MNESKIALRIAVALALLLFATAGCNKVEGDQQEAIRQSVEKHLAGNSSLNRAALDMSFQQIQVNGDKAAATVLFRLKDNGATMQMDYNLERHAGNWVVLKSQPTGGQFAHPPMDQVHSTMPGSNAHPSIPNIHDFFAPGQTSGNDAKPAANPHAHPVKKASP